jgi:acylphosphatase
MGLQGWVRNRRDETVEILVSGDEAQLQQFEAEIRGGPRLSLVEEVKITCDTATTSEGFEITATV